MAGTVVENGAYDTETVEKALLALALHAGSPTQASQALKAQGIRLPKQTLHDWKTSKYAQRYEEVCDEASSRIADKIAAEAEAFMLHAARVELKALHALEAQIDAGETKDVASALRNITTSKALNNDKVASPLRGRATTIVEHKTAEEALNALERLGLFKGTAEDITDADVVETPQPEKPQLPASC